MIDTHCHLAMLPRETLPSVLARAWDSGLTQLVVPAGTLEDIVRVPALVLEDERLFGLVGYHPEFAGAVSTQEVRELRHVLEETRIVGIGEAGIDFYWKDDPSTRTEQEALCRMQVELAGELGIPISLHLRDKEGRGDAAAVLLAILQTSPGVRAILHSSTLDRAALEPFLALGCWVSYSGILTFKTADTIRDAAASVPPEKLLIETDTPYLAPVPHRGKDNEPSFVRATSDALAAAREEDAALLWERVGANARTLFGLPDPA